MNIQNGKIYVFISITLIAILFTNSYFDYEQSLIFGGSDGISYYEISKNAPFISDIPLKPIHAERFFFSYLIGIISKITQIEIYLLFRIFTFILIISINYYLIVFLKKYDKKFIFIILALLLFNLNPYQTRFYIANPLIITDLFFILGSIMSINGIDNKNKKHFYIGLIIASLARQSAIAIIISIFLIKVIRKDKFFISKLELIYSLFIFTLIYLMGFVYSKIGVQNVSHSDIYLVHFFGIFQENVSIEKIIIFIIWPFLSFSPLILFFIFFIKKNFKNFKNNLEVNFFVLFYCLLVIAQPIFSGVEMSGKNIIRLSSFAFLPILLFLTINFNLKEHKNLKIFLFIVILVVWTCHPTFSKFEFLESIKF